VQHALAAPQTPDQLKHPAPAHLAPSGSSLPRAPLPAPVASPATCLMPRTHSAFPAPQESSLTPPEPASLAAQAHFLLLVRHPAQTAPWAVTALSELHPAGCAQWVLGRLLQEPHRWLPARHAAPVHSRPCWAQHLRLLADNAPLEPTPARVALSTSAIAYPVRLASTPPPLGKRHPAPA
jgi:hypothetical protein